MPVEQRKAGRWRQRAKERRKHAPQMSSGLKSVKRNASMQTFNWCSASVGRLGNRSHPLLEPETSLDASADLLWRLTTNWRAECQKLACSVRREGRPHPSSLPLSSCRAVMRERDPASFRAVMRGCDPLELSKLQARDAIPGNSSYPENSAATACIAH